MGAWGGTYDSTMTTIRMGDATDLVQVEALWLTLHHHDREICDVPLQPDDAVSWRVRRDHYTALMQDGSGLLFLAEEAGRAIGYAFAILNPGADDTWGFEHGWAEIYSLSVAEGSRSSGVGTQLLEAVAAETKARGLDGLEVAAMTTNTEAIRFYQERGFQAAEIVLLRFGL